MQGRGRREGQSSQDAYVRVSDDIDWIALHRASDDQPPQDLLKGRCLSFRDVIGMDDLVADIPIIHKNIQEKSIPVNATIKRKKKKKSCDRADNHGIERPSVKRWNDGHENDSEGREEWVV
ncbi:hypothetical protein HAX54_003592 [Datura stramonium]|uniref:Uncharacterized protein n=1 Tax=Datura stramonium TaxID=4076 RepID=A0ABS8T730_DATST|nr:hypothetical protein [Datura stramonium]